MRVLHVAEKPSMARQIVFLLAGQDADSVDARAYLASATATMLIEGATDQREEQVLPQLYL